MAASVVGNTFFGLDLGKVKKQFMGFKRSISKRILLIDFDVTSVTLAEAQVQEGSVNFAHVRRLSLPEDALERGIPTEPRKMAGLIKGFCEECDIPAHRAAVVIPQDAVFTMVLSLPSSIDSQVAMDYLLDPASAAQVPVQLEQMDADLIPLGRPGMLPDTQAYFLVAIPRKLVDRVLEALQLAEMDLLQLQVGIASQLHHCASALQDLDQRTSVLHLDLCKDCTLAALLIASGPVRLSRLTSIRDFPDPPEQQENSSDASVLNAEAQIIASDSYLPLTDLDLRRLTQEIKQFLDDCSDQYPDLHVVSVLLSGANSAHPLIDSLLQELLQLPVQVSRPLATQGVGQFTPDEQIVLQSLGRLIGLGLSFLPSSDILSSYSSDDQSFSSSSRLIAELEPELVENLQAEEQQLLPKPTQELELLLPVAKSIETPQDLYLESPVQADPDQEQVSAPECDIESNPIKFRLSEPPQSPEPNDLPLKEEPLAKNDDEVPISQTVFSFGSEDHRPSSDSSKIEPHLDISGEIQSDEGRDEVPFSMDDLLSSFETKATGDTEKPKAQVIETLDQQSGDEEEVHLVDDPTLWPSISKLQEIPDAKPEDPEDDS